MPIIICLQHLSLDVASQFVAIGDRLVPPVIFMKRQRRLLIMLVGNIQCKCIKNVNASWDGGWDLGCTMKVTVRMSYVEYHLTSINDDCEQEHTN